MAWVIIAVIVAGLVVAYLSYLRTRAHRDALARFAAAHGLTYVARDDSYVDRWRGTPFGVGTRAAPAT